MRRVLLVAVLVAVACAANTASAAGSPASLAANVAAAAVGHRPVAVVRVVTPLYRPRVFPAPVVVPAPVVLPRVLYYGPRYCPMGGPIYIPSPYVSYTFGY